MVWAGLSMVGLAVLGGVLRVFRRRFRADQEKEGFLLWPLPDLLEMRVRGELTEDEFERLKTRVLDQLGAGQSEGQGRGSDAPGPKRQ